MAHFVIAGPRSLLHPILCLIGCFAVASMVIAVADFRSGYSILNNNVNTFSIKTIGNPMSIDCSRLPFLSLSDRVLVVVTAAAVVFRLHLEGMTSW